MISYYKTNDGYIAVTDQSPPGFENLVFIGRGGPIDDIQEQLFSADVLTDPVNVADVPHDWCTALGYHDVIPLLDPEGENLVAEIPVRVVAPTQYVERGSDTNTDAATQIGMAIGLLISIWLYIWR